MLYIACQSEFKKKKNGLLEANMSSKKGKPSKKKDGKKKGGKDGEEPEMDDKQQVRFSLFKTLCNLAFAEYFLAKAIRIASASIRFVLVYETIISRIKRSNTRGRSCGICTISNNGNSCTSVVVVLVIVVLVALVLKKRDDDEIIIVKIARNVRFFISFRGSASSKRANGDSRSEATIARAKLRFFKRKGKKLN